MLGQPLKFWEAQLRWLPRILPTPTPHLQWLSPHCSCVPISVLACEPRASGRRWPWLPAPSSPRNGCCSLPPLFGRCLFAGVCLEMAERHFPAGQAFECAWLQLLSMLLTPAMYFSLSKTHFYHCARFAVYTWGRIYSLLTVSWLPSVVLLEPAIPSLSCQVQGYSHPEMGHVHLP